jgi:hypothetical protein
VPALQPACLEHGAAAARGHAGTKPVRPRALSLVWLVSALHLVRSFRRGTGCRGGSGGGSPGAERSSYRVAACLHWAAPRSIAPAGGLAVAPVGRATCHPRVGPSIGSIPPSRPSASGVVDPAVEPFGASSTSPARTGGTLWPDLSPAFGALNWAGVSLAQSPKKGCRFWPPAAPGRRPRLWTGLLITGAVPCGGLRGRR